MYVENQDIIYKIKLWETYPSEIQTIEILRDFLKKLYL